MVILTEPEQQKRQKQGQATWEDMETLPDCIGMESGSQGSSGTEASKRGGGQQERFPP